VSSAALSWRAMAALTSGIAIYRSLGILLAKSETATASRKFSRNPGAFPESVHLLDDFANSIV